MRTVPWYEMDEEQEPVVEMWDEIRVDAEKAFGFADEGYSDITWLPKSQVKVKKLSRGYEVTIPFWLAKKKGLV